MSSEKRKRASQTRMGKAKYLAPEAFVDLKVALEQALAFEKGKRNDLNTTRIRATRARPKR